MPGFDGTGPMGQGALTGGGRGYCAVNFNGTGLNPVMGRRFLGRGGGRGYRNRFYATGLPGWMMANRGSRAFGDFSGGLSKEDEISFLKEQAVYLQENLESIQTRLKDLDSPQGKK